MTQPNLSTTITLAALQTRIGTWALRTFEPTPAPVHAARMGREMADVYDCVAIGNHQDLGRALAGVFVVGLAMAESQDIDLVAALLAEQDENEASEWRKDSWGQWVRNGDGDVPENTHSRTVVELVRFSGLSPKSAARLLMGAGAAPQKAKAFLIEMRVAQDGDFQSTDLMNLRPDARGVDVSKPRFNAALTSPDTVSGPAIEGIGI